MKLSRTINMTEGDPISQIIAFTLPMLAGAIFQQLYTVVDSAVVGRFVGALALGSVGSVTGIINMFLALCIGLSGGVNIYVAQCFGAGDEERLKKVIGNSVYVMLASGFLMGICGAVFARPILIALNTPAENIPYALTYMRIVCGAMIITAVYNFASQIMRALGDSITPLIYVVISSIINVVLDIVLVTVFHLGVAGVAIATLVAQLVSAIGMLAHGFRKVKYFHLKRDDLRFNQAIVCKMCTLGIPLAIQTAMGSISSVVCQRVVNSFGSNMMSAYTIVCRLNEFFTMPFGNYGTALSGFAGQNMGAAQYDRIKEACRKSIVLTTIYSVVCIIIIIIFHKMLAEIFVEDSAIVLLATEGLIISGFCMLLKQFIYIYKATLNGTGDSLFAMYAGVLEVIAAVVFIIAFTSWLPFGYHGIWYSFVPTSVVAAIISIQRFYSGKWKKKGVF